MANGNSITLCGNVCQDPELSFLSNGSAKTYFTLAVNRRWRDKVSDEWKEATSFVGVSCWTDLAENVAQSCPKGTRVIVTGRLDQRSYETTEGDKRSVTEVVADEVGPSLRWTTAEVTKTERRIPDAQQQSSSDESPF